MRLFAAFSFFVVSCLSRSFGKSTASFDEVTATNAFRLYHLHGSGDYNKSIKRSPEARNKARATHNAAYLIGDKNIAADRLVIELPDIGDVILSRRSYESVGTRVRENDKIHRVWSGDVVTENSHDGNISFLGEANFVLQPSNELTCTIKIGSLKFRCQPCLPSNGNSEFCIDIEEVSTAMPQHTHQLSKGKKVPEAEIFRPGSRDLANINRNLVDDGSVIDVLILYTPAAIKLAGSEMLVQAEIAKSIAQNNKIYANSMIELEVQVVGWQEIEYTETGDIADSLTFVTEDAAVSALRDDVGADLVLMITSDYSLSKTYCNYGYMTNPASSATEKYAFSVVDIFCMQNFYEQFGSVWGRAFGCDENFDDSDMKRVLDYAYNYQSTKCDFNTILARSCGGPEVPYYSSPLFQWTATEELLGSETDADCSRVIREYKEIISQYRDTVVDLSLPTMPPTPAVLTTLEPTSIWVELVSTDISTAAPTPAPTVKDTPEPTAAVTTPEPTAAVTTPEPTASVTTPEPTASVTTPEPTAVEYLDDGKTYSVQFQSTLVDQEEWDDDQMDSIFLSVVETAVLKSVSNAEEIVFSLESTKQGTYSISRKRVLQDSSIPAVRVAYRANNIYGNSMAKAVSGALIEASDNGYIVETLPLLSSNFTVSQVLTEQVGDPEVESSGSSSSNLIIIVVVAVAFVMCSISCCAFMKRNKLKICCAQQQNQRESLNRNREIVDTDTVRTLANVGSTVNDQSVEKKSEGDEKDERSNPVSVALWDGIGAVASNLPYFRTVYGICDGIYNLFTTYSNTDENFKQVMKWVTNIKNILMTLEQHLQSFPNSQVNVDMSLMDECQKNLQELLHMIKTHQENNMLLQFTLSVKMQDLIQEASIALDSAISRLNLGVGVAMLGINLRIDENVSTLISAVHEMKVDLSTIALALSKVVRYMNIPSHLSRTISSFASSAAGGGEGPILNERLLARAPDTLKQLEIPPTSLDRVKIRPIGVGTSAKVYLVKYNGHLRAAKVVSLIEVPLDQLQDVYLKFTWELYVLTMLKSPRVVEICGSITSVTEYTLVLEYMEEGSLRQVLDKPEVWKATSPLQRHTMLRDIAEGMAFLHANAMHHRDLKSHNVLLNGHFRAKISDFGLTKTATCVSSFSRASNAAISGGGTLSWMPPEAFRPTKIGSITLGDKRDVYAYGIVSWEVLSGFAGSRESTPWRGYAESQVITKVLNGERPVLPEGWDKADNINGAQNHYEVLQECWKGSPDERPSFKDVVQRLRQISERNFGAGSYKEEV